MSNRKAYAAVMHPCVLLAMFVGCSTVLSAGKQPPLEYDLATGRNRFFQASTWPSDHGDSSRTKYTLNAGLPIDLDPDQELEFIHQTKLVQPQWLYTSGNNSEYLYLLGGPLTANYVAKVNATSLEVLQTVTLPPSLYMGGLLMHANGNVYAVHRNIMYLFHGGDLYNSTVRTLPTTFGNLAQTNGMVLTHDGLLVVKQWLWNCEDMLLIIASVPPLVIIAGLIMLISIASTFLLFRTLKSESGNGKKSKDKSTESRSDSGRGESDNNSVLFSALKLFIGVILGAGLCLFLVAGIAIAMVGPISFADFFRLDVLFRYERSRGTLKLIDPITLDVVQSLEIERSSFPRMALSSLSDSEDAIVLVGDEFVHQYRWKKDNKQDGEEGEEGSLYEVTEWAQRYRTWGTGTVPGTGPAIFNQTAYFTDNTFPLMLWGRSYSMFSKPLHLDASAEDMQSVPLTSEEASPGYMFWSTVVSPVEKDVIVWDTAGRSVQARSAQDLSMLHWEIRALQLDCISLAADRGHVYLTDYSDGPPTYHQYLPALGPTSKYRVNKYFIVADAKTGAILVNTTLFANDRHKFSMIMPGANNDVFVTGADRLTRIVGKSRTPVPAEPLASVPSPRNFEGEEWLVGDEGLDKITPVVDAGIVDIEAQGEREVDISGDAIPEATTTTLSAAPLPAAASPIAAPASAASGEAEIRENEAST